MDATVPPSTTSNSSELSVWPSILTALLLAVFLPWTWIAYAQKFEQRGLNFHALLMAFYVPIAFGTLWPLLVALHAILVPTLPRLRPLRPKIAAALFLISIACSVPFVRMEYRQHRENLARLRTQHQYFARAEAGERAGRAQANREIATKGILAFSEPLTSWQGAALHDYFVFHKLAPGDCLRAAQHYPTDVHVLIALANNKTCSPDGLKFLYDDAHSMQTSIHPMQYPNFDSLLIAVANNLNTPPLVLVALLQNDLPFVRIAAAKNPNTPKPQKIAYLKQAALSSNINERQTAAINPDTPPDILAQLASDPQCTRGVANNPGTPPPILQKLIDTNPDGSWVRRDALQNLSRRQK
jgi:hypothetical protein